MAVQDTKVYKKAFPISTSDDLSEKILNEENITGIIKNICGRDKFIIGTYEENSVEYIKFILDGYYFEIANPGTTAYASISYNESVGNSYIGKTFSALNIAESGDLQLTDENGYVIADNKVRFNSDQLPNNISCGNV